LENDDSVVDWDKGLNEEQAKLIKPVSTISKNAIEKACIAFRNAALGTEGDESPLETEIEDVTVYEHTDFPGKLDEVYWMRWTPELNNINRLANSSRYLTARNSSPLDIANHAQIHGQPKTQNQPPNRFRH
jgi:hypothetical protein